MMDDNVELANKLSLEITNFKETLAQLKKDMLELQIGSDNKAFWCGETAYGWIKATLAHLDHNKVLEENLEQCLEYLQNNSEKA